MNRQIVWVFIAALGGCGPRQTTSEPPGAQAESTPGQVHQFSNNWGNSLGCAPTGPELTLEGTIEVRPFGKGTDGARLKTADEQWVVSYRAEGALLALDGKRVVATGRACDKDGASIASKHFDLKSLTER